MAEPTTDELRRQLREALQPAALTDQDERILTWLGKWDNDVLTGVLGLVERAREAERRRPLSLNS